MSQHSGTLRGELAGVLNAHSVENRSGTPDFVLAEYLIGCLDVWDAAIKARDRWWGFEPKIGDTILAVDP